MKVKLAEALGRRKELQGKVDQLKAVNVKDLFEVRVQRKNVTDSVDDIIAQVPKIDATQIAHAYDWHAKQLRRIDAVIQQANWGTEVEVDAEVIGDYTPPAELLPKQPAG